MGCFLGLENHKNDKYSILTERGRFTKGGTIFNREERFSLKRGNHRVLLKSTNVINRRVKARAKFSIGSEW